MRHADGLTRGEAREGDAGSAREGVVERGCAVAFGEPGAIRTEHERHVRVSHLGQAEQPLELALRADRGEEVGAAHHLADLLVGVVEHDRELVAELAVGAPHHHVLRHHLLAAEHEILDRLGPRRGAQSPGGAPAAGGALRTLAGGELAAGAWVRTVGPPCGALEASRISARVQKQG